MRSLCPRSPPLEKACLQQGRYSAAKKTKHKQKQYCNKSNKDFLKMIYIKKSWEKKRSKKNFGNFIIIILIFFEAVWFCFIFYFLAVPHSMWGLRSSTRDQTCIPCFGSAEAKPLDRQRSPQKSIFQFSSLANWWGGKKDKLQRTTLTSLPHF